MTVKNNGIAIKSDERTIDDLSLSYALSVSESQGLKNLRIPLYSVSVTMIDSDGKETYASCDSAFSDIGLALLFYGKIVRGLATPMDLAYIYEDECC